MLWREGYAPLFLDRTTTPVLLGRALDGSDVAWTGPAVGFDPLPAPANVGIWARLFRSEGIEFRIVLVGIAERAARDLFPPSDRSAIVTPTDSVQNGRRRSR